MATTARRTQRPPAALDCGGDGPRRDLGYYPCVEQEPTRKIERKPPVVMEAWETSPLATLEGRVVPSETITPRTYGDRVEDFPRPDPPARDEDAEELEIMGELGRGGFGVVMLGRQSALNRQVAVKRSRRAAGADVLRAEARLMGALEHRNIVPIYQLTEDAQKQPLLVMKRIEGEPWSARLRGPPEDLERELRVFIEICYALEFAHSRGVIHRDIKPGNVMIGEFGQVWLLDWGLASQGPVRGGTVLGTPAFMAPEMLSGRADLRTDIFQLGATLHRVVTGQPRYAGSSLREVMNRVAWADPPEYSAAVPSELVTVLRRAMSPRPADRHQSVAELRRSIEAHLAHRGAGVLAESALRRLAAVEIAIQGGTEEGVVRGLTECRFGLREALKALPSSTRATEGLERCLRAWTSWELDHGSPESAAAWLAELRELGAEPRELADRLERLREKQAELQRLQKDHDFRTSSAARGMLIGGVAVFWLLPAAMLGALLALEMVTPSYREVVFMNATGLTVTATVVVIARKTLLANAYNRRVMFSLLMIPLSLTAHRLLSYRLGLSLERNIAGDMLLVTVILAVTAYILPMPRLWPVAVIGAMGSGCAILFLDSVPTIVTLTVLGALGALAIPRSDKPPP